MIETVDYHTAGEPFRIVTSAIGEIPGATVLERRESAVRGPADEVRRLLCNEPRGHADMYGCFLVPPDDDDADLGCLFWHKDGFSTACGHGTIALARYAVDEGLVDAPEDGEATVRIDVPSGRVVARVAIAGGEPVSVAFRNVPAYTLARSVGVETSRGAVEVDLAYGGAVYASARAADLELSVSPRALPRLIELGREVKETLAGHPATRHPRDDRLSGVYGVIWFDELEDAAGSPLRQRNCTVFADGEVDRSPCGSGTSARLALLAEDARVDETRSLIHESVLGTVFVGSVVERLEHDGHDAVVTEIEGNAHRTGTHAFTLDPSDPLGPGFQLR